MIQLDAAHAPKPLSRATRWLFKPTLPRVLAALPIALTIGALAGRAVGKAASVTPSYRMSRLQAVTADLAGIKGDYLLAAGDSHIERWPSRSLCGLPLVNAGLSGATASSYADFLDSLPMSRPPRAVILTIGTNDANTRRFASDSEALRRFEAGYRPLLARLRRTSRLVMVTGVPTVEAGAGEQFSAAVAEHIGEVAETACRAASGCAVANPFPHELAKVDGVHYADYAAAYRALEPALCRALAGQRAGTADAR